MAIYEDGSYSSAPGIALIAKVLAGRCTMHYTRVAVGKGTIPEDKTPKTMTEPADYVMDARIAAVTNPVNGECQVTVQIDSSDVEHGFYCTGILLYAEDPDDGEVPYTYLVLENGPEWIRPSSSAVGKLATFDLIAAVGDVDHVTAAIDPDSIATIAEVHRLIAEGIEEAAEDGEIATEEKVGEMISEALADFSAGGIYKSIDFSIAPEDWTDSEDGSDYPFYADIEDEDITAEMTPNVNLAEGSLNAASICGVCSAASTYAGYVRIKARRTPQSAIAGTCSIFAVGSGGGGGSYVLPTATSSRLGGIKIGAGLAVQNDGTASVDTEGIADDITDDVTQAVLEDAVATDRETDDMIDDVFGDDAPDEEVRDGDEPVDDEL